LDAPVICWEGNQGLKMSDDILETEEKYIVLKALQALHNLKYVADLAIMGQKNTDMLEMLIEEVVKIRKALNER